MNSWVKDSVPAALSPAATVVALERDLLLSSLSRPAGSAPPIAPGAVSEKAGASVRAAAEVVALVRRGEYVAALASAPARALLLADAGVPDALADASAVFAAVDASVAKRAAAAAHPDASPVEPAAHELLVLAVGVAALSAFQQANVTGPDLRRAPHCPALHDAPVDAADAWNRWATRALSLDGEDLVGRCFLPQYLYLARALLVERAAPRAAPLALEDVASHTLAEARAAAPKPPWAPGGGRVVLWPDQPRAAAPSLSWWASRAALVHQRLLSGRSPTLRRHVLGLHALTLAAYAPNNRAPGATSGAAEAPAGGPTASSAAAVTSGLLASMALLEAALMEHEYGHVDSARALVKASGDAIACEHEIAGEMGFRTIHQVDAKAQMVLRVACAGLPVYARERASGAAADDAASDDEADELMAEERAAAAAAGDASAAKNSSAAMARIATELEGLSTDGAQVLTAPRLVSQDAPPTLPAAVQAIILAAAVTVRKSQADDGTRSWSVAPYHEAVQTQRRSRPVLRAAAAVLASRHERERPRTRERALLSMEDLVKGLDAPAPSAAARARFAHSVWFPPGAMLRKELGDQLVALGMVGAALELFEEIELWDSLIVCLTLLGKKQAAADTVRRRLEVTPDDPKLWCALGDALDDEAHFHKALEVSEGKSARALRSLARRAAAREDWPEAATRWSAAMAINPLFQDGWFSCGYACLKSGREEEALRAFVRCTQMDPENGQAWNNVAALNIRKGSHAAAHVALQEATKQLPNSWQTWENLGMVAAKIGRFQQSARALLKVMELTQGAQLHVATLSTLVERCKEARAGVATWLGAEEREEAREARIAAAKLRSLGGVAEGGAEVDEEEEEEEESWEGVRAPGAGGGDAGDAAADMLDAFFSDSDEEEDEAATAAAASKAAESETVAGEVLAREVVRLEASVEEVLKRALGGGSSGERGVKDTANLWRLFGDFREARGERLVAAEARLKRLRALDTSGWRKDPAAFAEYVDASLEMCRGHVKAAEAGAAEEEDPAEASVTTTRGLSQARMHLRGVVKAGEAAQFHEGELAEVFEELKKCAEEVAAAEERAGCA